MKGFSPCWLTLHHLMISDILLFPHIWLKKSIYRAIPDIAMTFILFSPESFESIDSLSVFSILVKSLLHKYLKLCQNKIICIPLAQTCVL